METAHNYMLMDRKMYKLPVCHESSCQIEQKEPKATFTMVIETDNYRIEIEIG